jgi:hypothetical protein
MDTNVESGAKAVWWLVSWADPVRGALPRPMASNMVRSSVGFDPDLRLAVLSSANAMRGALAHARVASGP